MPDLRTNHRRRQVGDLPSSCWKVSLATIEVLVRPVATLTAVKSAITGVVALLYRTE